MNKGNIRKHKYTIGGALSKFNESATSKLYGSKFGQGLQSLGVPSQGIGGIANAATSGLGSIINPSGNSTGIGNAMQTVGSIASVIPGVGGLIGAGVNLVGGLVNSMFGSKINEDFVNQTRQQIGQQANYVSGASTNADLLNEWSQFQDLGQVQKSQVGSDGWFSHKASNLTRDLNANIDASNLRAKQSLANTAQNIDANNDLLALANYSAYGGPINMRYSGVMSPFGNRFAEGGKIYIKPSKRGTFTAAAKKHGKSVQAFASQVLANKDNYSSAMVKKANFARNFGGRKRAYGGPLQSNGANWNNGITYIGNGGTHEQNPYEGVYMGVDQEGVPNLVEQNETVFGDYVFSDRLHADGDLLQSVNLPKSYKDKSFSEIAKKLGKESQERPNDPISRRGLLSSMSRLQQAQEIMRQQNQVSQEGVQYAHGGKMGRKYDGKGDKPNFLQFYTPQERQLRTLQSQGVIPTYTLEKPYSMMTPEERTSVFNTKVPSLVDTRTPAERWINENIKPIQFNPPSSTNKEVETTDPDPSRQRPTWLRYAPAVGSAIGLVQNLFSKPDYSSADAILEAANQAGNYQPVSYTPIGNYLQYKPFDRDFYINKLNAQSGATRRALADQSGGNRATAMAGLLAADYNAQGRLGDLARQAEEYNLAQRQAVEQFNRATDQANAEMGLKAAMANQEAALKARSSRLSGVAQAMATRDAIDARRGASMNANLTNLFDSLGNIGKEEFVKDMIENNPALLYDWLGRYKGKAKGGYLTVKKRGK